jgi:hypothetical protein
MIYNFKVGQKVKCIPFKPKKSYSLDEKSGGAGYSLGKVFTIKEICYPFGDITRIPILFPYPKGNGIYGFAVIPCGFKIDDFNEEF